MLTTAVSVAKFTLASMTLGIFFKARSTRDTQEAHVMPSTGKVMLLGLGAGSCNCFADTTVSSVLVNQP